MSQCNLEFVFASFLCLVSVDWCFSFGFVRFVFGFAESFRALFNEAVLCVRSKKDSVRCLSSVISRCFHFDFRYLLKVRVTPTKVPCAMYLDLLFLFANLSI